MLDPGLCLRARADCVPEEVGLHSRPEPPNLHPLGLKCFIYGFSS